MSEFSCSRSVLSSGGCVDDVGVGPCVGVGCVGDLLDGFDGFYPPESYQPGSGVEVLLVEVESLQAENRFLEAKLATVMDQVAALRSDRVFVDEPDVVAESNPGWELRLVAGLERSGLGNTFQDAVTSAGLDQNGGAA